jgi:hypothetical protein
VVIKSRGNMPYQRWMGLVVALLLFVWLAPATAEAYWRTVYELWQGYDFFGKDGASPPQYTVLGVYESYSNCRDALKEQFAASLRAETASNGDRVKAIPGGFEVVDTEHLQKWARRWACQEKKVWIEEER